MGNKWVQVPGGSRKKPQSKPGKKQQVSDSRPREVRQHADLCSEGSDGRHFLGGESSSRVASLRQQAGRAQNKSRRERQVVRLLMSETFLFFMRNLLSENLSPA